MAWKIQKRLRGRVSAAARQESQEAEDENRA